VRFGRDCVGNARDDRSNLRIFDGLFAEHLSGFAPGPPDTGPWLVVQARNLVDAAHDCVVVSKVCDDLPDRVATYLMTAISVMSTWAVVPVMLPCDSCR
jgi:hypothetical protein